MKKTGKMILILGLIILSLNSLNACTKTSSAPLADTEEIPLLTGTAKPVSGGTVIVGISQDLDKSLDPHISTSAGKREILYNIFEGLVKPDSQGNLVPALASSWKISDAGDQFTFILREGVKFHNGAPLTVNDVKYSLDRCRGTESGEPLISAFTEITSIEIPDEKTIIITLKGPNIEFLAYLTAAIIPANYTQQDSFPIGTGPFQFGSRSVQENIILEKNPDYWGSAAWLDQVTFKIIENPDALVMALRSGAIDLCVHRTPAQAAGLENEFTILRGNGNLVQALYLNQQAKPLDDLRVRQALNYAVDIQAVLAITADGMGTPVGSSMYPAFARYFLPELSNAYPYDPEKAKTLLAEAGYPEGFDLTITVPSNYSQHVDVAQVVAEQLKQVGVNAKINLVEWATWLSTVYKERDFESTISGFDASALTARAMLERWTSSSPKNMINFTNEEYDSVMAEAMNCTDEEKQTALYKRAETILSEQAANVYLQDPVDLVVMNKKLAGYVLYPLFVIDMSQVYYLADPV